MAPSMRMRARLGLAIAAGSLLAVAMVGSAAASVGTVTVSNASQTPSPVVRGNTAAFTAQVHNTSSHNDRYFRAYSISTTTTGLTLSAHNCVQIAHGHDGTLTFSLSTTAATQTGSRSFTLTVRDYDNNSNCNSNTNYNSFNTGNGTIVVSLPLTATTTIVASSLNPSIFGQAVTFTATVSAGGGTVTFMDGATSLGTGTLSGGVATLTTSSLAVGNRSITAVYGGDGTHAGSTSSVLHQTVQAMNPNVSLAKVAEAGTFDSVGDVITYDYTLSNDGNVTLVAPFAVVDDLIPSVSCPSTASLDPGDSIACTGSYAITADDLNAGSVTNTATGSGYHNATKISSTPVTVTVPLAQSSGLELVKAAAESMFSAAGDTLHYTYTITNTGNVTLDGPFTVTDSKIASVSCPATATLAPGDSIVCTATYTVTADDVTAGEVVNTATARGYFATQVAVDTASVEVVVPFQVVAGETAVASATPPSTSTGNGLPSNGSPLFALLICFGLGSIGLLGVYAQRRNIRS